MSGAEAARAPGTGATAGPRRLRRIRKEAVPRPYLLDFLPLESADETELSAFFDALREGRFVTTQCRAEGRKLWPPRRVCPSCHRTDLVWVDLPTTGRIYAWTTVCAGAPLGMESEVPFSVALVDLEGADLRLYGRLETGGATPSIGAFVEVEAIDYSDGRVYYRFRLREP